MEMNIGLSDMLNAAMAQQQMYQTAAAYSTHYAPAYQHYIAAHSAQGALAQGAIFAARGPGHPAGLEQFAPYGSLGPSPFEQLESPLAGRQDQRDERSRRDRDRDRDRSDRRDRDRDGDRDHDRPPRDRDRDRDRNRDRPRDRDREYRSRDRSPRRDRDRDRRNYNWELDDESAAGHYKTQAPNNTVMVRGLATHVTENDIRADIVSCRLMPKDIRLVRKKDSGASRGFAFVEFMSVQDAQRWMEVKQGVLLLQDGFVRSILQYSIPKDADRLARGSQDWFCIKCGAHNFKRRDSCYKCCTPRHEAEAGEEGIDEVCSYPTNILIFRGLDVLSTEEAILQGIQHVGFLLPIRSVRIGRDPLTNTSRGVCYVELNSVMDSVALFNILGDGAMPLIDGKEVSISYCKLPQTNSTVTAAATTATTAQTSSQLSHTPLEYTVGADIGQLAEYCAATYAQTPEEHEVYLQYYTEYYKQQAEAYSQQTQNLTQSDSANAAAALAHSALQAVQKKSGIKPAVVVATAANAPTTSIATVTGQMQDSGEYPTYPPPDVSTYQYDKTSGFYYDPSTGLYYDANTTYYYNSEAGQYLYWDAEKSSYLPAPTGEEGGDGRGGKKDKDNKSDKVKVAKKIAKDMARWAKAQNKRTEVITGKSTTSFDPLAVDRSEPPGGGGVPSGGGGAADAAFAILLERKERQIPQVEKQVQPQVFQMQLKKEEPSALSGMKVLKKSGLVAAYGDEGGSDSEGEGGGTSTGPSGVGQGTSSSASEEKLVDYAKMACLLCKRQFPNREALNRHVQLSDLHRNNLEGLRRQKANGGVGDDGGVGGAQYRDRARERRMKYGEPDTPAPNRLKERYMAVREDTTAVKYEEPTRHGIGDDNVGSRLLKKMGWSDGQGLGLANQGRTNIIEAERRVSTAGLGMQGAATHALVGDTYKDCVKKTMMYRYQGLDDTVDPYENYYKQ